MAWSGVEAIKVARNIIGPTNGRDAAPGTIRGDWAMDIGHNIIHGSDAEETAEFELGLWFPEGLVDWTRSAEDWVYEE
jgi:nucleoside-diphosphate kinase